MDKETKEALKESIAHWAWNADNPDKVKLDPGGCALCLMFHPLCIGKIWSKNDPTNCDGCPVKKKTGRSLCINSPYYAVEAAYDDDDPKALLSAIRDEHAFLLSLLPKGSENV